MKFIIVFSLLLLSAGCARQENVRYTEVYCNQMKDNLFTIGDTRTDEEKYAYFYDYTIHCADLSSGGSYGKSKKEYRVKIRKSGHDTYNITVEE